MTHYQSNVRDLEFNLFEMYGLDKVLASGEFGDMEASDVRILLQEAALQARGPLAETFADADRNPPSFDPHTHHVRLPEGFKAAVRSWDQAGWNRLGIHEAIGGTPSPPTVPAAINEFLLGANPAAFFYSTGPSMFDVLYRIGNEQQRRLAVLGMERNWGTTMVLTEPDAGSDVGAARTRAIAQPDGTWRIDGVKRFITSADSDDLFENIVHLVLARCEGAVGGTKGLSLFVVPKFHIDMASGAPGERNGVFVTGMEHKMGLTASATCEVALGQHGIPAVGWLVGDRHDGIAQMFKIIENARMMIGTKSIATLSTGYLTALDYAKTRIQGADLARRGDKDAPRVAIIEHPDVRRSLLTQKAYAEGLRALYLYAASHQDPVSARVVSGADAPTARAVSDLLLPIVKGAGSERAFQCLTESLQTLGGSGYLRDYPIEQYLRDAKIDSLYEGTTAIQAQDFFFRKIVRDRRIALDHVFAQIRGLAGQSPTAELADACSRLTWALDAVEEMTFVMTRYGNAATEDPRELYRVGLAAVPYLFAVGDLLIGWLLLWQATIAHTAIITAPVTDDDRDFYLGKIAVARFFASSILPRLTADLTTVRHADPAVMDINIGAF
ncbi:butyryl-CoA dehydrogenase [Mycolicibacterium fortuitum]|uniref:acyl-CoA dehydrogenase n=1 Tax=Mycolicibacterium fortuitum TaxID=1766 RepID=UPI0007E99156|nr:acyl-CoA dehydrogenase [Mycolicibacterium fortuitum]OBG47674.1 butyryl-CoA dehydrogenase [Mycolicibacterium fortuitum]